MFYFLLQPRPDENGKATTVVESVIGIVGSETDSQYSSTSAASL
jgi:hypothetical protein